MPLSEIQSLLSQYPKQRRLSTASPYTGDSTRRVKPSHRHHRETFVHVFSSLPPRAAHPQHVRASSAEFAFVALHGQRRDQTCRIDGCSVRIHITIGTITPPTNVWPRPTNLLLLLGRVTIGARQVGAVGQTQMKCAFCRALWPNCESCSQIWQLP